MEKWVKIILRILSCIYYKSVNIWHLHVNIWHLHVNIWHLHVNNWHLHVNNWHLHVNIWHTRQHLTQTPTFGTYTSPFDTYTSTFDTYTSTFDTYTSTIDTSQHGIYFSLDVSSAGGFTHTTTVGHVTACCRVFLKLLTVAQLVTNFHGFYAFHHSVHKSPPLAPIPRQIKPDKAVPT
jgi:hypothetical protein